MARVQRAFLSVLLLLPFIVGAVATENANPAASEMPSVIVVPSDARASLLQPDERRRNSQ